VQRILVETFRKAVDISGTGDHNANPTSRESADHSIPYLVAATLLDGTVTPRSFSESRLWNPQLRELMRKVEVVEDPQLTTRSEREPRYGLARVHVITKDGARITGDAGSPVAGRAESTEREMIVNKFRSLTVECLGAPRVESILHELLGLDSVEDVAAVPPRFLLA
jgi:2-methylcitrate dehydratase